MNNTVLQGSLLVLQCVECGQSVYVDCTILCIQKVLAIKCSCCHYGLVRWF